MKNARLGVVGWLSGLMLTAALSGTVLGQEKITNYPSRPIRLIVPFSPGAANDIIARLVGQKLSEGLGQPVIIDNRPGAGGAIGADAVAKAAPDGYTLLFTNPGPGVITPLVTKGRLYTVEDLVPVAFICYAPLVIVANPAFEPKNPKELLTYAKTNPGKITWGSADAGGIPGLALALFQAATGADVLAVPYKGSAEAVTAVLAGHINVAFTSYASSQAQIVAGRLKVIGVAGPKRLRGAPEVPTLAESGMPNADATVWYGLAAPRKTEKLIVDRINSEVNRALTLADVKQRLAQLELEVVGGTPEEFAAVVKAEATRIAGLISAGKVKVE